METIPWIALLVVTLIAMTVVRKKVLKNLNSRPLTELYSILRHEFDILATLPNESSSICFIINTLAIKGSITPYEHNKLKTHFRKQKPSVEKHTSFMGYESGRGWFPYTAEGIVMRRNFLKRIHESL